MPNRPGKQFIDNHVHIPPAQSNLLAGAIFIFVYILLFGFDANAQRSSLNRRLTISFFNISLRDALTKLSMQNDLPISFEPTQPGMEKTINKNFYDAQVADILRDLLQGTPLTWRYFAEEIIIVPATKSSTLSGHVIDAQNGEDLIGANIFVFQLNQSTSSNSYGFYSLTLPAGNYELLVSSVGYAAKRIMVTFTASDQSFNIQLEKKVSALREVTVTRKNGIDSLQPFAPAQQLQWDLLREQPFFKGEADVVKALQMQNGVVGITEGSSSLFIRGGNRDQNLILLDEAVVYNPAHLFGITSVFNPDALKNIQLYKDEIPANFGGRLSSVIDARMADGDDKAFRVKGGMSLLSARLSLEGPVVKERGSFLITGRRSIANLLNKDLDLYNLNAAYYDLNGKINYKLNASNRLFFSAYFGRDRVNADNGYLNKWGNKTATLRWNHVFNPKLFLNLSAIYSNYRNALNVNADSSAGMERWLTGIRDITVKGDFTYFKKPGNQMQFGFNSIFHLFIPGETTGANSYYSNIPRARASENALYFSQKISIGDRLRLLYGVRTSIFCNYSKRRLYDDFDPITEREHTNYVRFEPRLMLKYILCAHATVQFSYSRNYQYLQLVQSDELAFSSLETWIPSSAHILPQYADMYSLTYKRKYRRGSFSLGAYYKYMGNQLELQDHAQLISNPLIEDELRTGRSDAYGLELSTLHQFGKFRLAGCYAWSKVFRKIKEINNGKRYVANYDIPHAVKLSMSYQVNNSLQVNSYFTYTTGRPVTFPTGYFEQQGVRVPIYPGRNLDRMPDYHHLDVNIRYTLPVPLKNGRQWINTFIVGLYNIYNWENPLLYKINPQVGNDDLFEQQTFSGITPVFSYSFSF
ncbi:hypothetical protein A3860_13770 [Niastella vici]|uniref:Secretin/TonB short N-terminal domain-containing protein n=1 Tax=Niastella vici TaxID=1703345 RepID=A0A1V9G7M4_9BACT|nr:TonB-dependent receptor [Niastella vici]OQP66544.1 hypothetical protein A3860_13770 [Niastella vici]